MWWVLHMTNECDIRHIILSKEPYFLSKETYFRRGGHNKCDECYTWQISVIYDTLFYQKSPIFYQKRPTLMEEATTNVMSVTHDKWVWHTTHYSVKRALFSIKRDLLSWRRPRHMTNECDTWHIILSKEPYFYQKRPTFMEEATTNVMSATHDKWVWHMTHYSIKRAIFLSKETYFHGGGHDKCDECYTWQMSVIHHTLFYQKSLICIKRDLLS